MVTIVGESAGALCGLCCNVSPDTHNLIAAGLLWERLDVHTPGHA